jgi:hypothetical protein
MPNDRDEAGQFEPGHQLAHLGGEARAANRAATLAEFVAQLPDSWDSEGAVKRFLEVIGAMSARGLLPGSQAGSAVRSAEAWIKAESLRLDRDRMAELEAKLRALEAARR